MTTTYRILCAILALGLASFACSVNLTDTPASPTQAPGSTDAAPILASATPMPPTVAPTIASTTTPALTLEQLKNSEVQITGTSSVAGAPQIRIVKLTDGVFQQGSDPAGTDYVSVHMGKQVAFGDLNGDGVDDAAIIIGENYGGTGDFVSVVAMLNQGGQPVFTGSSGVDDRPAINSIDIRDGQILLDAVVHGPNDPGCCAAQPAKETFRLWGGKLVRTGLSSATPDNNQRMIKIDSPAPGTTVSGPFTLKGSFTIAPFENNLAYTVFLEGAPEPVVQSSITVNAAQPGSAGTFELPLDFSSAGIQGNIRIEISDVSPADGSYLALETLFLTVK